jgi:Flp pilus assembly protein TadG
MMNTHRVVEEQDGAAAVEFAIVAPVLVFFAFACLQFAMLFFTQLSIVATARDITRWVTVNPNTVDSTAIAAVKTRLPSDMDASKLNITISPACAALVQNKCAGRNAGQDIAVTLSYDISSLYFLPTNFTMPGGLTLQFPSSLPAYTMHMQAEPS